MKLKVKSLAIITIITFKGNKRDALKFDNTITSVQSDGDSTILFECFAAGETGLLTL